MMLPGFPKMMPMRARGPSLNLADAAVFDGVDDYLRRTSALTTMANSKTLTLSIWFYYEAGSGLMPFFLSTDGSTGGERLRSQISGIVLGRNSAGAAIAYAGPTPELSQDAWNHVLISFDLTNSSNRHYYINDSVPSSMSWPAYVNDTVQLTAPNVDIGLYGSSHFKGKICHVFLDTTYRNLSLTAQRRLFNDGAGSPAAGQANLNPPLYLPLVNSNPWGENLGTGGDFTGYGALA